MGLSEQAASFGWPWPSRRRTKVEIDHIRARVYDQCIANGMSRVGALAEAATVVTLLPPDTEQPLGASRWLENRHALWVRREKAVLEEQ